MAKDNSKQIENMRKLGYTDEEIQEILADDDAIEHSKPADKIFDWEMDVEEHKKAIKNANADEKKAKNPNEKVKRERKPNPEKRELITLVAEALLERGYNATVTNVEKIIEFSIGEQRYSFSLIAHRK